MTRPRARVATGLTACALALTAPAWAAFPDDPPDDPEYDSAEEGSPATTCSTRSVNDEQHYFYSFIPQCTPAAAGEGKSGMSIDRAWEEYSTGRGDTVIAYVEGGINWQLDSDDVDELANKVFLNEGELPPPTTPEGDGVLNALDYADTPDHNGNGIVDPEDVIVEYEDGDDDDGNGYPDDISGWDFYDDQNNPATTDAAYDHANNQMEQAAAETDNATKGAGVCPKCQVLPIKAGAEALDRTDDLAEAWLYASDMSADVIVSVTADLGYSSFMRQAVEDIWERGETVMVEASNDFDSLDHQGGMFWPHVIPGNGLVTNSRGIPGPGANALTRSFRVRSGQTSWGTHNMFSAATQGGSTSTSTPTIGGVMGLVLSFGKTADDDGDIDGPLTSAEAVQVVRDTAFDIKDPEPWPGKPGWDMQYGYGRPNVYKAMRAIEQDEIPPVGWIARPHWYALYDPTDRSTVPVRGHVEAPRSGGYDWKLEYAPGPEPKDSEFMTAGSGSGSGPHDGELGEIDLSRIPESFWSARFRLSETKTLETNDQYAVTLRLRVEDEDGLVGEDRRAIAVRHDPSHEAPFPKRIGPGGEGQAALADLQGKGRLATVFGDADGVVHAVDGVTGRELPGWPARTRRTKTTVDHGGIDPGREPVIANVAVGDLDGTGELSVVATSSTGRVYAFDERGRLRDGWPSAMKRGAAPPESPRPPIEFTRLQVQGASAPPVLQDLDGDRELDVVQAAWDGHLHAWHADGSPVDGWPVRVELPAGHNVAPGHFVLDDRKLVTPPAVADLDGDGEPELVQRSQQTEIVGAGIQPSGRAHLHAYHADGSPVDGFPVDMQGLVEYYGSGQEFITEGTNSPAAADVDGDGDDEIASGPVFSPTYLIDGDGSIRRAYGAGAGGALDLLESGAARRRALGGNLPLDVPLGFTTSGAFGRFGAGDRLTYSEPGSGAASTAGALLVTGSGLPINNYLRASDARSGGSVSGFPALTQGLDFLGAPVVADVTGDGDAELLEGGDSSALHGFAEGGDQAAGFPKFTTGWLLYAPSVGDLDSDGESEVVALSREGYLSAWSTPGKATGNDEWWAFRHDERNTARYGLDTRPPGVARGARAGDGVLRFRAPGDDWYAGTAKSYRLQLEGAGGSSQSASAAGAAASGSRRVEPSGPAGSREAIELPQGTRRVTVQAVDDARNLGRPVTVAASGAGGPGGGGPGEGGGSGDGSGDGDGSVGGGNPGSHQGAGSGSSESAATSSALGAGDDSGGLPLTGYLLIPLLVTAGVLLALGRALRRRSG